MTMDQLEFDNPLPEPVIETARQMYAAPADPAYWSALEAKVMARLAAVSAAPVRWWQVLNGWTHGGIVAAAMILAIVGALLMHVHREEMETAYDAILRPVPAESLAVPLGVLSDEGDPRGETFRDVISR
jgi:hypothetical protein